MKLCINKDAVEVKFALTGKHSSTIFDEECPTSSGISVQYHQFDFEEEIEPKSTVFCQASRGMNDHISQICRPKKAIFFGGLQSPGRIEVVELLRDSFHSVTDKLKFSIHET